MLHHYTVDIHFIRTAVACKPVQHTFVHCRTVAHIRTVYVELAVYGQLAVHSVSRTDRQLLIRSLDKIGERQYRSHKTYGSSRNNTDHRENSRQYSLIYRLFLFFRLWGFFFLFLLFAAVILYGTRCLSGDPCCLSSLGSLNCSHSRFRIFTVFLGEHCGYLLLSQITIPVPFCIDMFLGGVEHRIELLVFLSGIILFFFCHIKHPFGTEYTVLRISAQDNGNRQMSVAYL